MIDFTGFMAQNDEKDKLKQPHRQFSEYFLSR